MTKQGYMEIPIPAEDHAELTKLVKDLGFESVDEFVEEATKKHLEKLEREVEAK